ncbi:MAG: DUF1343 domain-containing protein, partial [Flavobacterium macrobrachii]
MISISVFKNTVLFSVLLMLSCGSSTKKIENREEKIEVVAEKQLEEIKTGADNSSAYLPLLKDKKVGIITNQTGILSDKTHLVDFLLDKKINV